MSFKYITDHQNGKYIEKVGSPKKLVMMLKLKTDKLQVLFKCALYSKRMQIIIHNHP